MRALITLILNLIWFITAGFWLGLAYIAFGIIACVLIVTIPFGLASFRIAGFIFWPFGREVVDTGSSAPLSAVGNIIWFIIAGIWLAAGHVITALAQAATIVGIPLAWANLKLIPITCFPFGKKVVNSSDKRSAMLPTARR